MHDYDNSYVRNNLSLTEGPVHKTIGLLLNNTEEKVYVTPGSLDICLRSLDSILQDKELLDDYELNMLTELLNVVWDRYLEDRICTSYY